MTVWPHIRPMGLGLLAAVLTIGGAACGARAIDSLPRHQALKTFDPHRKDFTCKYEADAVPAIDPEAEQWNQEALYVTRFTLWSREMDWKKAEELWIKAAERKHWKAMMNLASLYEKGAGDGEYRAASVVERDSFKAVEIVEEAMRLGIPAAFDKMGNYHSQGFGGIRQNGSRAWAFWEMAADMGNPQALTHIGKALAATYDNPEEGFWGNMPIAIKMLECAVSQGFGQAALELGVTLRGTDASIGEDNTRALQVLHEGVKFGSEDCANSLFSKFNSGDQVVGHAKDPIRAARYNALGDVLYHNPDLRFPNLDKVVPLPPANLPYWDGKPESLIDAAKATTVVPPVKPTPGAGRTGRAHIPDGWVLAENPLPPRAEVIGWPPAYPVEDLYEQARVSYSGYWLPQVLDPHSSRLVQWNKAQVPLRYAHGEHLDPHREGLLPVQDGRVMWRYMGEAVRMAERQKRTRVRQGLVREVVLDGKPLACRAGWPCPETGIWDATAAPDHPQAKVINHWWRQMFIEKGTTMPDARAWGFATEGMIGWELMEPGEWDETLS